MYNTLTLKIAFFIPYQSCLYKILCLSNFCPLPNKWKNIFLSGSSMGSLQNLSWELIISFSASVHSYKLFIFSVKKSCRNESF
uniref:Uncharacterized protein n=1 Tax=Arundo donax TaxID=35708 RepID=A0A0A9HRI2_ARUDO